MDNIKKLSVYPVLILEEYLPHALRHKILRVTLPILLLLAVFLMLAIFSAWSPVLIKEALSPVTVFVPRVAGAFLLLFACSLIVYLAEVFYRAL
ncbi:hypothetical protein L0Y69_02815, partial [bacterium]|nr:hypothetical protein [bacterium]